MNTLLLPESGTNLNRTNWSAILFPSPSEVESSAPSYLSQRRLLETVLNQLLNGVLVCDTQGKILLLNDAAKRLVAPHLDDIGLERVSSVFGRICYSSGELMPLEEWSLSRALRGEEVANREERIIRPDGSFSDILVSGTPLRNNQGAIVAAIMTCIDITEHKRAEAHTQSIAQFPAENPNPILRVSDTGAILYANEASHTVLRCWDCQLGDFLPDAWHETVALALQSEQIQTFDIDCAGKTFYFQVVPLPASNCVNLYGCDMTERKHAEEMIRQSQDDLNRAQAVAQTGSWRLDVQNNELRWSDETYRMFGINKGTPLTYEAFLATIHPDDRAFVDRSWMAALRGEPYDIEHRIVVGPQVKWVRERAELEFDDQGNLCGGFGTVQDITERKRVEDQLRYQAMLIENSHDAIFSTNLAFEVVSWNKAAEQLYGWTADEVRGKILANVMKTEYPNSSIDAIRRQFLEQGHWQGELIRTLKDGTRLYIETSAKLLIDRDGQPIGTVAIERDITDQKRAEQTMLDLMAEQARMRALTEFVQSVSHDFKTPLSTLKTSLYLLSRLPEPGKQQRQIAVMAQQTQHMANLLEGILTMTRLDTQTSLELQPVELNELVQHVFLTMQSTAHQKGVTPVLDLPEKPVEVAADEVELVRALLEIMKNAIQFTPSGGTVTLRTLQQTGMATVEIQDTGSGIDATELPRIFERLYRVDKARSSETGGIGLGLAIAQKIITLHGGILEVTSAVGQGSTFRVTLPLLN